MQALLITGTDTGVGKTHAACVIARQAATRGLRVGAYKPVCSGAERDPHGELSWDDLQRLSGVINVPFTLDELCPQRFLAPLAPPLAAKMEGREIQAAMLRDGMRAWENRVDLLLIEGAGGFLCPFTESTSFADFARECCVPILIIARPGLGTINHTLLTIEAVRQRNLTVAGVLFSEVTPNTSDVSRLTNADEIERRGAVRFIGTIPYGSSTEIVEQGEPVSLNWLELAGELQFITERSA